MPKIISKWKRVFICDCGRSKEVIVHDHAYNESFHNNNICPNCGEREYLGTFKVRRWIINNYIWYRPATWAEGYWEYKGDSSAEEKETA